MSDIIILVIASRGEIYDQFINECWIPMIKYAKRYSNIKIFLIFGNDSKIDDLTEIKDNILVFNHAETMPNILEKTLDAFDLCLNKYNFDFMLRTNLSSFIMLDKLIAITNYIPKNNFVGGSIGNHGGIKFVGGAAILFSRDVIQNLIDNRKSIINDVIDDVDMGKYMQNKYEYTFIDKVDLYFFKIPLIDVHLNHVINEIKKSKLYQVRLKNPNRNVDVQIIKALTQIFYK